MAMFPFPGRDERAALQFDDLASALDAGLTPEQVGAEPGLGDHAIVDLLRRRRIDIDTTETRILAAAWQAGRIGQALRLRAERRRQRANDTRVVLAGLRYPIFLLVVGLMASVLTWSVTGNHLLPLLVVGALALLLVVLQQIAHALRTGEGLFARLPFLAGLARQRAELPYLEVLHGLYASGVPLLTAHPQAVATCTHERLRADLQAVDTALQANRPLGEAMRHTESLSSETRSLLATGETAGDLEGALHRALRRRGEVVARSGATLARWTGILAYVFAAAIATWLIFSMYFSTYGKMLSGLRR